MIPQRWQPLAQLVAVRFREFVREPEVIFWVYGFPLALALGLGYAFSSAKPVGPTIDVAESAPANEVASHLGSETWKDEKLTVEIKPLEECKVRLKKGRTALFLIAHANRVEYVYDPARSDSMQARYWTEAILSRKPGDDRAAIDTIIEEKGSRYIDFLIPGLIGMNIMGGGLFGVGFVLVDMRMRKLFKRMMATPMRHSDFLLALLISRLLFLLPEMASLLAVGYFWFEVPIHGSILSVIIVMLVGSVAFSGIGLLVGCRAEKTESISGLMNMIMLPQWIFSGVLFSSRNFPAESQPIIQALPLTQLNDALREVMLEGASFMDVSWRLAILAAYGIVTFALALRWFKWR